MRGDGRRITPPTAVLKDSRSFAATNNGGSRTPPTAVLTESRSFTAKGLMFFYSISI